MDPQDEYSGLSGLAYGQRASVGYSYDFHRQGCCSLYSLLPSASVGTSAW